MRNLAAAGANLGEAPEHAADNGVPKDDTFFYPDLLKRGNSLVIAHVDGEERASAAKEVLKRQGVEDVDEAGKKTQNAA